MLIKRITYVGMLAALLSIGCFSTASSRIWKATPQALARDYALINDTRPDGEAVFLGWFVPGMIQPNTPGAAITIANLQTYVVLVVVHGHLNKTTGSLSFEDVPALEARDQTGKPLTLVVRDTLPPTTAGIVVSIDTMFRQSLGALGKGMKLFVFDAGDVNSCKRGSLSVPLAGDTYTWDTPIPGCS